MSTTSRGIDVSAYQGVQDWPSLARSGLVFAFAKASEGQHSRDSRFGAHMAGIIAAGLVPGAYHYAWPSQDPAAEAANYVAAVKPFARRGFIHILDLERRSDGANYGGQSSAQIRTWAEAWIARVRAAYPGQRVIVYTSASDIAAGRMPTTADALWYPAYPSGAMSYADAEQRARPAPSGRSPLFWQFTSTPIDRSIAYLSPDALRAWAAGDTTHTETDMPLSKDDITAVAKATAEAIRWYKVDNPTAPGAEQTTFGGLWWETGAAVGRIDKALGAPAAAVSLTDAQVTAIGEQLAAAPGFADRIATKVADLLAARLQS